MNLLRRLRFKWWLFTHREALENMEPLFAIIAVMEKEAQIYGDS